MSEWENQHVTNKQLKDELDDVKNELSGKPSKFEVRFLILAGLIAAQAIPVNETAQAAMRLLV